MSHPIDSMSPRPSTITMNPLEVPPSPPKETGAMPSDSPWAKMFPQGATQDELKMFISAFIKTIMDQAKHDNEKWKEAMRRQKDSLEGG